jgi:hypothetical protein
MIQSPHARKPLAFHAVTENAYPMAEWVQQPPLPEMAGAYWVQAAMQAESTLPAHNFQPNALLGLWLPVSLMGETNFRALEVKLLRALPDAETDPVSSLNWCPGPWWEAEVSYHGVSLFSIIRTQELMGISGPTRIYVPQTLLSFSI